MTAAPEPMTDLDLRGLRASIESEDGDLMVVVHDGETCIRLESGMGGTREQAILGAERLIEVLDQYVGLLKVRAGSWTPFRVAADRTGELA
ncbi:hypothetical protein [Dactylosporangium sp. NPDC005555]|uniref:hypothetical protein n=1 Tax=Dactylosporangium sp. NPDC005555 TaxID=3154889 RepID=UPI0033AF6075